EKLATAIREIAKGNIYVSREVAVSVFRKTLGRRPKNNRVLRSAAYIQDLSDREIHIFQLLGSGLGPREIAASLNLSIKTVETHQENIKHKLQLRSCAELRERAAKWVQQSLGAEEHLFRGEGNRKKRVRSTGLPVVAAFDAQQTAGSQVEPETA